MLPSEHVSAVPAQWPAVHRSLMVQMLPSLQAFPVLGEWPQPCATSHVSLVHGSLSAQLAAPVVVHKPPVQASPVVQALLSVQLEPSVFAGLLQTPVPALQTPTTWHWSSAPHTTGLAPTHAPLAHVSTCVHGLPSLQPRLFIAAASCLQPLAASQVSSVQAKPSLQFTAALPRHLPAAQASPLVHALPSSQPLPSDFNGLLHKPVGVAHVPATWHWSCALQTTALLPVQVPATHASVCVHRLPSLHSVPLSTVVS